MGDGRWRKSWGGGYYVLFVSGLGLLVSRVSCQGEASMSTVAVRRMCPNGNKWPFYMHTSKTDDFKPCDLSIGIEVFALHIESM